MNKRKKGAGKITQSGNLPRPGQKGPATIILTQPRRFGIDIADYMLAVRAFENVDYSRRFRLYDLFSDILMDTHLTSVIEKRKNAALASSIEFRRNGKPDEKVNKQIRSPWFRKFIGDILDAKFWGFSLVQFYRKGEWVNYDLIPRKHVDPVRRLILRHQTDTTGTSWDEYPDLLFIGSPDDPGLLVKAAIWVIYKRNDVADWAQFAEVFGAPIREYTYPTDDDEARQRALDDADSTGSLSVFVHAEDTVLKLVEDRERGPLRQALRALQQRNLKAVPRKHAHHRSLRQGHTGTGNRTQGRGGESDALRQAGHPRRAQL
jgi:hypothetical protein